jgi:peptidoglycan/LPS O-acetylase OafA/YrhL
MRPVRPRDQRDSSDRFPPAVGAQPSTAPAHVPALDGFRGAAALLVLIYHCWLFVNPPLGEGMLRALVVAGSLGVDFFFVLSGFVLFLPVARRGGRFGSVRSYLVRRVARIVPAYYASLLFVVLALPLLNGADSPLTTSGGLLVAVAHLLFVQHELPTAVARAAGYHGAVLGFGVNGVVWSLSLEALFYLTLPLVAGRFFRRPGRWLAGCLGASVAWWLLAYHAPAALAALGVPRAAQLTRPLDQYPAFFGHFACGMFGALLYVRFARGERRRGGYVLGAQAIALLALLWSMTAYGRLLTSGDGLANARNLLYLAAAASFATLMTTITIGPAATARPFTNSVARWLGDVSYGVFLWHMPLIFLVLRRTSLVTTTTNGGFLVLCALVLPASLVLGWLSRRLIEEPAIRWARTGPSS